MHKSHRMRKSHWIRDGGEIFPNARRCQFEDRTSRKAGVDGNERACGPVKVTVLAQDQAGNLAVLTIEERDGVNNTAGRVYLEELETVGSGSVAIDDTVEHAIFALDQELSKLAGDRRQLRQHALRGDFEDDLRPLGDPVKIAVIPLHDSCGWIGTLILEGSQDAHLACRSHSEYRSAVARATQFGGAVKIAVGALDQGAARGVGIVATGEAGQNLDIRRGGEGAQAHDGREGEAKKDFHGGKGGPVEIGEQTN